MKVAILVPRRADGGWRDTLWSYCRAYWERELPDYAIVEGDHNEGPFNRSAGINRAASLAGDWDVGIVLDADVVLSPDVVVRAVEQAHETGRAVLPFSVRNSVSKAGTSLILKGSVKLPAAGFISERQAWNVSTCVIVPRALWDLVGGFDERFEGWGGEDDAFHAACRTLGGVDRIKGDAWHLWHARSPWRNDDARYRAAVCLADRYCAVAGINRRSPDRSCNPNASAMRSLLVEDRGPRATVAVCLTNGKRPAELARTLASLTENVNHDFSRRIVVVDGKRAVQAPPGWDIVRVRGGSYYRAMREAQRRVVGSGQPWIFWTEDDFEFNQPVILNDIQDVMDRHPECVQMSLMRQPWYASEINAGGVFQSAPEQFEQQDGWVSHRAYWTQNPMLVHRLTYVEHAWPQMENSERRFADLILSDKGRVAGVWGSLDDDPWVTHLGARRAGVGY